MYYEQIELGYNYRMTDVQAALGLSQLARIDAIVAARAALADRYDQVLRGLPLQLPGRTPGAASSWHLYVVQVDAALRRPVFEDLRAADLGVNVHYIPVHLQPYYRRMGFAQGDLPQAEGYYSRCISIPLFPELTQEQQDYVVDQLRASLQRHAQREVRPHVVVLGAGPEQVAAIRSAARLGLQALALDRDPHAPGLRQAARGLTVDIKQEDEAIAAARAHGATLVVPTPLGRYVTTAGAIDDALGLRGPSRAALERCVDKHRFHATLAAAGLRPIRHLLPASREDIEAFARTARFPVVMKPRFGSGGRRIFRCNDGAALLAAVEGIDAPELNDWVVEEMFGGSEVGLDAAVLGGRYVALSTRAKLYAGMPPLEAGYRLPSSHPPEVEARMHERLAAAVGALGLDDCLVHADAMVGPDGAPGIIEVSGRPAGMMIASHLLPAFIGFNPVEAMLRALLHDTPLPRVYRLGHCLLRFFDWPAGRVTRREGLEAAARLPGLMSLELPFAPGDVLAPLDNAAARLQRGFAVVRGVDDAHADALFEQVRQTLDVATEGGA